MIIKCCSLIAVALFLNHAAVATTLYMMPAGEDAYSFDLDVNIDGVSKNFSLDTGAAITQIQPDSQTEVFYAILKENMISAAGDEIQCDQVAPTQLSFDSFLVKHLRVLRCPLGAGGINNLGIDAFAGKIFSLNFLGRNISMLSEDPAGVTMSPLKRGDAGHMLLPVTLAGASTLAIFDTGASYTSVDTAFVKAHPESFTLIDSGTSSDATENDFTVQYYWLNDLKIGTMDFQKQKVAVFNFPPALVSGSGASMLIGSNTMVYATWVFDLKNNLWSGTLFPQ